MSVGSETDERPGLIGSGPHLCLFQRDGLGQVLGYDLVVGGQVVSSQEVRDGLLVLAQVHVRQPAAVERLYAVLLGLRARVRNTHAVSIQRKGGTWRMMLHESAQSCQRSSLRKHMALLRWHACMQFHIRLPFSPVTDSSSTAQKHQARDEIVQGRRVQFCGKSAPPVHTMGSNPSPVG